MIGREPYIIEAHSNTANSECDGSGNEEPTGHLGKALSKRDNKKVEENNKRWRPRVFR